MVQQTHQAFLEVCCMLCDAVVTRQTCTTELHNKCAGMSF